jgi:hypothetical protein
VSGTERSKRRRKRRVGAAAVQRAPVPEPGPSKDEIAREQLVPLREGERPLAVTIAAVVAGVLVVVYVVAFLVSDANVAAGLPFVIALAVAAAGMWRSRYWAVLGFQVILALTLVNGLLFLLIKASGWGILAGLVLIGVVGSLFWFLVKALARIQMPERRPPRADG